MIITKFRNAFVPFSRHALWSTGQVVLMMSAAAVALFSLRYALPHVPAPAALTNVATRPVALRVHAVFAAIALLVGPWQFIAGIRRRYLWVHRAIGRCYAFAVLISWIASLPIAFHAQTGPIAAAGFLALGACWVTTTTYSIVKVAKGDIAEHRRWMFRSYALATAAMTLRIYLGLILGFGIPFVPGYRVIAWACWLPNILLAELMLRRLNKT